MKKERALQAQREELEERAANAQRKVLLCAVTGCLICEAIAYFDCVCVCVARTQFESELRGCEEKLASEQEHVVRLESSMQSLQESTERTIREVEDAANKRVAAEQQKVSFTV